MCRHGRRWDGEEVWEVERGPIDTIVSCSLKSRSCVCCAELVFSCTDGSGNWFRERLVG